MLSTDSSDHRFIRVRAVGVLNARDYCTFAPEFSKALARRGQPVPMLLDLTGFRGWTPGGFWSDIRFDLSHRNSFSKIAVVGNNAWHRLLTLAAMPVFRGQLKFFGPGEDRRARDWLGPKATMGKP